MIGRLLSAAGAAVLASIVVVAPACAAPARLIPYPASIAPAAGGFQLTEGAKISAPAGDAEALFAAQRLADLVAQARGLHLIVAEGGEGAIVFQRTTDAKAGLEGYELEVSRQGVRLRAAGGAGLFYGAMTLAQLASPDDRFGAPVELSAVSIQDAPRFAWRGLMLDVARHFQPLPSIEGLIDQMAAHKLNVLHLHLTDDQGWRLEIKRYPKLTEVGAWRAPPGGPADGKVGGFYTQEEMRVLVAYAAQRHVTIVPEIDMPGHAQAAVAAYPEVGVFGDRPTVSADWGVNPYLFSSAPQGLAFVGNVLDEVVAIFPSTFVHVGGDEAIKDQWRSSPAVQAQMASLGVKDEHALQSWYIQQLGEHLAAKGRRLIGWDEILEGGLPPSASVMSWRGEQGAIDAANAGHDVVLSPGGSLYFDHLQSARGDEPPGRFGVITLKDLYAYDPMPAAIAPDKAGHVLGLQGNVWTEYLITPEEVAHAVFPRLDALSEIAWSPKAARDWPGFLARLDPQLARYQRAGVKAADSAFAVDFTVQGGPRAALRAGRAVVTMTTQAPYGRIRYSLDPEGPGARWRTAQGPVTVPRGGVLRAMDVAPDGRPLSAPRRFEASSAALLAKDSSALAACPTPEWGQRVPLAPDATEPTAININLFDACTLYPAAPLDLADGFRVDVVRLARNYGLAQDFVKVTARYNATRFGELVVRAGGCEGPIAATFPLPDPAVADRRLSFEGRLPGGAGDSDLCMVFTAPVAGPLYAIERVALTPRDRKR